ncbi:hypothetical protein [Plebeiibacterium marinum]|uniref:3-oxoacyl-ACP synthase n=1 Tax=Plebeiibacterium marinum TaxID=2992111 RepID=A0AAE3SK17_9BACT|nr:hypothetical protein [Plebeiobacterium marinum]MCW3806048.1 hypothetical protein [Plebeiobacterium marinum]
MSKVIKELIIEQGLVQLNGETFFKGDTNETVTFLKSLYKHIGLKYGKFFKMDSLCKLGFLATEILLDGVEDIKTETDEVALVFANASSSLNTDVNYQNSIAEIPSPAVFVYTLPNIVIGEISIRHKFYGEHMFFIQEKYNKEELLKYTDSLFAETQTKFAVVGWLEMGMNNEYSAQLMLCSK